jgi:hypothetical protein
MGRERFQPRRAQPKRIGSVRRTLVAPDGSKHRVRIPIYGPPTWEAVRLPELGLPGTVLGLRGAARHR